jgi:hypothetical protein
VNSEQKKVWTDAVGVELPYHEHKVDRAWWSPSAVFALQKTVNVQDVIREELLRRFGDALDMHAVERAFDDRHRDSWADRHLLTGGPRKRKPSRAWTKWFEEHLDAPGFWSEDSGVAGDWYFDYDKAMAKLVTPKVRASLLDAVIAAGWLDLDSLVEERALWLYHSRRDPRQTSLALNKRGSRRPKRGSRRPT